MNGQPKDLFTNMRYVSTEKRQEQERMFLKTLLRLFDARRLMRFLRIVTAIDADCPDRVDVALDVLQIIESTERGAP